MKILSVTLLATLLAAIAAPAAAGSKGHGLYGQAHGYARHAPPPHLQAYRPAPASRRLAGTIHAHPHHQHALRRVTHVVVLGPVVTTLARPRPGAMIVTRPAYAVSKPYAVRRNHWHQWDAYGDCFEVRLQRDGQQVWTQVAPRKCG
jgi:hypothetical protein